MSSTNKIYFTNLDALRFFAFLSVFIAHVWGIYLPSFHTTPFILWLKNYSQAGVIGVNFFFVLSGFLITYLLFAEREKTGANNVLKFYVRRTLRIWPLYFGIVLVSFLVVPFFFSLIGKPYHEPANIFDYLFFIANFQIIQGIEPYSPLLFILWSIAIEEQFYFSWILLFKFLFRKIVWLFVTVIIVSIIFRTVYIHQPKIIYFHTLSVMSDFAIGGLTAYLSFYRTKLFHSLASLSKRQINGVYLFILVILFGYNYIFQSHLLTIIERVILGVSFAFIIFEQNFCVHSFFKAGSVRLFSWLGKISYGLYCFHPLAIKLSKDILLHFNSINNPYQYMIFLPVLAISMTVFISWFSYTFYEKWFLQWKEKFSFR